MRHVLRIAVILLVIALPAWKLLSDKSNIDTTLQTATDKAAEMRRATSKLFQAITPLTRPESPDEIPTANIDNQADTEQTRSFPRIKQRNNNQQKNARFEKIAFNGETLDHTATRWSCARDIETGLLWETKLSNGGVSDTAHTYSWFTPEQPDQGRKNGGNCYGTQCDTYSYIREMNRMALCDSRKWRLPLFSELERLIDRAYYNPTINQSIFPHTRGAVYWTGTELENNPEMVMQVDFFNGVSTAVPKNLSYPVRVVSD